MILVLWFSLSWARLQADTGHWVNNGPPGPVYALCVDPHDSATLFAGSVAGVFRSNNGGRKWVAINSGLTSLTVYSLAVDSQTPATLYAGTYVGLFKSIDGGDNWKPINNQLTSLHISSVMIDPQNPSIVYVGMTLFVGLLSGGIFKSNNGGLSWIPANAGLTTHSVNAMAIDPGIPAVICGGTDGGVYKSSNGAESWVAINTGLIGRGVKTLAVDPQNPSIVYAGTEIGVFKSWNGGTTWKLINEGLNSLNDELNIGFIAIDPQNPAIVYAGMWGGGAFKSTNRGESWSAIDTGITARDILVLAIDPQNPNTLFAGGFDTVFRYQLGQRVTQIVPIVLEVQTSRDYFKTELALTNKGKQDMTMRMRFTASLGQQQGSGTISEIVQAGQQFEIPHVISYLREKGLGLPVEANPVQGGTLLLEAEGLEQENDFAVVARTTTETRNPQPEGRAGLAYSSLNPDSSFSRVYIYGLRANLSDRSNLAVYNMSPEALTFKVSVFSGEADHSEHVVAERMDLSSYGWTQFNQVLVSAGISNGYAVVERLSPAGALGAYGVVNDNATGDGSFIPAMGVEMEGNRVVLPVLVEVGSFESELVLCNRGEEAAQLALDYVESLSPSEGAGGTVITSLLPGEQRIIPSAIDYLENRNVHFASSWTYSQKQHQAQYLAGGRWDASHGFSSLELFITSLIVAINGVRSLGTRSTMSKCWKSSKPPASAINC